MTGVAKVGFVGLGVMGQPMAGHLLEAGNSLTVWNRTPAKSEPLRSKGATVAGSLVELAETVDTVFLCVGRTEDVEECIGSMATAKEGTLFVDHSTIAPSGAIRIGEQLRAAGLRFVDAPVTGGSMGAQKGQLTIFCGGAQEDFDDAVPIMAAYTKRAALVGPQGAGQTMKIANQIAVGGALQALCESLAFARKAGLDVAQTRELLAGGAAGSWAFDNYGPKILAGDWSPGFSIKNQRKDFGYALEAATEHGANVPGTVLVDDLLKSLEDAGHGELTTALLYRLLAEGDPSRWT